MRLLITADFHYNHTRSRASADAIIDDINAAGGDAVLVVGDTAAFDGPEFEECLTRFTIAGPKLVVAGNHDLWTRGADSFAIHETLLPDRARRIGWHWLEDSPFRLTDSCAVVGSIGWYDYSFAEPSLGIPARFYAAKCSPGAAERLSGYEHLFTPSDDISARAREVAARWNDGRFIKLGMADEAFLSHLLQKLGTQLDALRDVPRVIAAIHHLPFRELLPPSHSAQWDFAKAYLGSHQIGNLLLQYPNVTELFSGHSHYPAQAQVNHIHATNIGSGYRAKHFKTLDIE